MKFHQRSIWALVLLVLLVLLTTPTALFAQDGGVVVTGSGVVHQLFRPLADAAGLDYDLETVGTDQGFAQFCSGSATVVNADRALSLEEEVNCVRNDIQFAEMLLGYDVLAYIAHPELEFVSCLAPAELDSLLAPTAAQNTTWDSVIEADENATPISVYLPPADSLAYLLLDEQTAGVGFRRDAEPLDAAAVVSAVAETPGALGVVPLSAVPDDDSVKVIELRNEAVGLCVAPSVETAADGSYIAGKSFYSYVSAAARDENDALNDFIAQVTDPASAEAVVAAGYTAPTEADYEINAEAAAENGRQFSRSLTEFQIPPGVAGAVTVGGAAGAHDLIDNAGTGFNQQYTSVTVSVNMKGEPDGLRRLCNGEIDLVTTYAPLSEETLANCAAIDINVLEVEIGKQAAVLVANDADEHLACLTTEQIVNVWGADAAELPTNWQDIDADFPDQDFVLFASSSLGNAVPNLMLQQAGGTSIPLREDTETNPDPLYRAAAVANVEGSLTFMTWDDYQNVLVNDQQRIQLVAVDGGDGCITPDVATIASGDYPLTRSVYMAISKRALERQEVQSFLWFLFGDDRLSQFERANFDLISLRDLGNIRETLQTAYGEANAAAAERAAAEAAAPPAATEEAATE